MSKLFAIAALVIAGGLAAAAPMDASGAPAIQASANLADRTADPQKRLWFGHAIGQILDDGSEAQPDAVTK